MEFLERHILEALIYVSLLAGVVLIAIPASRRSMMQWTSVGAGFLLLAGSLFVFIAFDHGSGAETFQMVRSYPWLSQLGIDFRLGVDGIAAPMVLLTGIVSFTGAIVACNMQRQSKAYFVLLYLLIAGVYGTFVSIDLFFLFFFYELAIVPMYLLIANWGSSSTFKDFIRTKEYGAMKLVLMIVAASVLVWIAIIAIFIESGTGSFNLLGLQEASRDGAFSETFQRWVFPLVMIGFGLLAGLWPFHTWSPDGHVAAPTSVSMLHAGVLMKLGAFGIIRVGMMLLPEGMQDWAVVLFVLGTINVIYGAVSALAQNDLKYVIGYSSVSHMGYVLMGLATLDIWGVQGATLQMFSHGVMTALFFTVVGAIYERTHTRDSLLLNGLASRVKWITVFFVIAGMTSLGLPGLSGFIAEVMIFVGAFRTEPVLGILGVIGAGITAVYILRLTARVFFGQPSQEWDNVPDLSRREVFAASVLTLPIILIGVYPMPFLAVIEPGVSAVLAGLGG
ncbi:MAG: NADH-quinone oxidoreductase subunit M [Dehalococcoidia bacterium]